MFKVGDIVLCNDDSQGFPIKGEIGKILKMDEVSYYVEYFNHVGAPTERDMGKDGHCIWSSGDIDFTKLPLSNPLNKKLYPDRKEYKGFLVPENLADKLGEEREY